ncbi:MAG: hypothetical protein QOI13_2485 [Paraburkholderia sp.]|nr:hypothetical protein [Paraburkholderia sp.]
MDSESGPGAVHIYEGKGGTMWVNAGQPLRALKWFEKYKVQADEAKPLIRSFAFPLDMYHEISKKAFLEFNAKDDKNRSFNVDRHFASDQFGIRGEDLVALKAHAVPGSLITYTDNPAYADPATSGKIESTSVLRERLGVPETPLKDFHVFVDKQDFAKREHMPDMADQLMELYGTWMGNRNFLPERRKNIPIARRWEFIDKTFAENGIELPQRLRNRRFKKAKAREMDWDLKEAKVKARRAKRALEATSESKTGSSR